MNNKTDQRLESIDTGEILATMSVDLSNAFDSQPHGLRIGKLLVYEVDFYCCKLLASHLYNSHERVKCVM